jgi:hypothetical protein
MRKLAFCFLIYDIINHEELWHIFFKNVDTRKYTIYIHYKNNSPLTYFEKYKVATTIDTSWGDISLVKAQNILLQEAITCTDNTHFIFLSNSCIPLKSFDYVYRHLQDAYSYFNICDPAQCFPRCNSLLDVIHRDCIQKASQWCILNRKHSTLMLSTRAYLDWFAECFAPDEHCYITTLFYHDLQGELITTPNIASGATTFTNWGGMDYKYPSNGHLKTYLDISAEELGYLLDGASLFGRKFDTVCAPSLNNTLYSTTITSSCVHLKECDA